MQRKWNRRQLCVLAESGDVPEMVKTNDSYDSTIKMVMTSGGDIGISIIEGGKIASATLVGVGGGDFRPLTMEALRLLMLAIQIEQCA